MSTGVVAATAVDEITSARPHANAQTGTALRSDFIGAPSGRHMATTPLGGQFRWSVTGIILRPPEPVKAHDVVPIACRETLGADIREGHGTIAGVCKSFRLGVRSTV